MDKSFVLSLSGCNLLVLICGSDAGIIPKYSGSLRMNQKVFIAILWFSFLRLTVEKSISPSERVMLLFLGIYDDQAPCASQSRFRIGPIIQVPLQLAIYYNGSHNFPCKKKVYSCQTPRFLIQFIHEI